MKRERCLVCGKAFIKIDGTTAALKAILNLPLTPHLVAKAKATNDAYRIDTIARWEKKSSGIRFPDLPFEMTYSVIIPKREEWSSNDNKPFRIMVLIIFTEGLDMEDGAG